MSNRNKNRINDPKPRNNSNRQSQSMKPMDDEKFRAINKYNDGNDPDYYFVSKDLAEQAATFPFPYFLGVQNTIGKVNMPTCMVLFTNPCPGVTKYNAATSSHYIQTGTNMAAQKLYTRLSVASGRTAQYEPSDVILSTLAVTALGEMIEASRRFFGIATTYSARNRVYAWKILSMLAGTKTMAWGVDFVNNMADYRMKLNMIIAKINQIPLFADLGFVRKSIEMYQKVYLDSTSDMAQTYAFAPQSTWKLVETITETDRGTKLETVDISGLTSFSKWLEIMNEMADNLLNSTTLNMVYADLYNYQAKFGAKFMTFDFVLEGYAVVPEYNERVMQQIHNAVIVGVPRDDTVGVTGNTPFNNVISNDSGLITYNPIFRYVRATGSLVFDFITSTPDLVDRIDNIKFACAGGTVIGETGNVINVELPDHYITMARIYGARPEDYYEFYSNRIEYVNNQAYAYSVGTRGGDYNSATLCLAVLSKFNNYPLGVSYDASDNAVTRIDGDLTYFTTMEIDHFTRITELEYQGLFELRV